MAALDHPRRDDINALRAFVAQASPLAREGIKWNAPSYGLPGGDDCLTFRLNPPPILQIVLHRGARAAAIHIDFDDPQGLIIWKAADRGVIDFSVVGLDGNRDALVDIFQRWIACYSLK